MKFTDKFFLEILCFLLQLQHEVVHINFYVTTACISDEDSKKRHKRPDFLQVFSLYSAVATIMLKRESLNVNTIPVIPMSVFPLELQYSFAWFSLYY